MHPILTVKTVIAVFLFLFLLPASGTSDYPIDGYETSGIDRLLHLQRVVSGEIKDIKPPPGAMKSIDDITLNLVGDPLQSIPAPDPELQKSVKALFPNLDESYSIALLDITPGREIRYASLKDKQGYQPGSVGKLAVLVALFHELERIYPDSFSNRQQLLRDKEVRAGTWAQYDEHVIPVYSPDTGTFSRRRVRESDVFSLYEWSDHMLSASNNAAASVIWREVLLMHVYGRDYINLTELEANRYFSSTSKKELSDLAMALVNDPLQTLGISKDEWRLGKIFTSGATSIIPAQGGSTGTTVGFIKFMVAMESGRIVDVDSSLEMKRLLYLTDRRIRYSASPALQNAAVYFKSGSLYKCQLEEGFDCGKYMGNVFNFMNSIAIVEQPDGRIYLVSLMSNVLRKNSSYDHFMLASGIDKLIKL